MTYLHSTNSVKVGKKESPPVRVAPVKDQALQNIGELIQ